MGKKIATAKRPSEVLGKRIEDVRKLRGLTQKELSAKLGMHRETITAIESGVRQVKVDELMEIAAFLNVSPMHLVIPLGDQDVVAVGGTAWPANLMRAWIRGRLPLSFEKDARTFFDFIATSPDSEIESLAKAFVTAGRDQITLAFTDQEWLQQRVEDVSWEIKEGESQRRKRNPKKEERCLARPP